MNRGQPAVLSEPRLGLRRGRSSEMATAIVAAAPASRAAATAAGSRRWRRRRRPWTSTIASRRPNGHRARSTRNGSRRSSRRRSLDESGARAGPVGDPYAELKTRIHHAVHREARAELFTNAHDRGALPTASLRAVTEQLDARPDAADARGAPPARPRDHRRHPRLRPARAVPPRRLRDGGHGQRLRPGLRRASGQDRADHGRRSSTTRTCCGSSTRSSRRSAAASTRRRRWSTRASPTGAASTRSSRRSR